MMMGQYWFSPNKLSDQPETLSRSCYGIFIKKPLVLSNFLVTDSTKAMLNSEKVKPVVLAIVELRKSKGIR